MYESPVGALTLTASEDALTALSFPQERYPEDVERLTKEREVCIPAADKIPRILRETREWLDIYFSGKRPDFTPALAPQGSDFRKVVWNTRIGLVKEADKIIFHSRLVLHVKAELTVHGFELLA